MAMINQVFYLRERCEDLEEKLYRVTIQLDAVTQKVDVLEKDQKKGLKNLLNQGEEQNVWEQ